MLFWAAPMNIFVFDIETVPDTDGGRRVLELGDDLSDSDVANAMFTVRRDEVGHEFLRLHLQRIVAISVVLKSADRLKVWSLGSEESTEKELIERFFAGIERYTPTIVSWNGGGFDLPVLHYRAMLHKITAQRYWETGESDQSYRWNNYQSRYHARHTDLMDVLASFSPRANVPLDQMASLLGFPGKMGMSGAKVWETFHGGGIKAIRDYCETDVLNTYLVYLRFLLMKGDLLPDGYEAEIDELKNYLKEQTEPHFHEFLEVWQTAKV